MTSPLSPDSADTPSFRVNFNRTRTKRWAEAKPVNYDADDWGDDYDDDPALTSSTAGRQPASVPQNTPYDSQRQRYGPSSHPPPAPSSRSFTNQSPVRSTRSSGRGSFDHGDDRQNFSSNATGFEGPYPTTQRVPFTDPEQFSNVPGYDLQTAGSRGRPPPQLQPHSRKQSFEQDPVPQAPFGASHPRGGSYIEGGYGKYPSDNSPVGRSSQSSGRPTQAELYDQCGSPHRIPSAHGSAVSQTSREASPSTRFPPRKSSLTHQQHPTNITKPCRQMDAISPSSQTNAPEVKPLPIIRPADIYKRIEEERERERRSQESSRQSLDSLRARPEMSTASAQPAPQRGPEGIDPEQTVISASEIPADNGSRRPLQPILTPVPERKSEYGFENMLQNPVSNHPQLEPASSSIYAKETEAVSPRSRYSDRADPITASSTNTSNPSLSHALLGIGKGRERESDFSDTKLPPTKTAEVAQSPTLPAQFQSTDNENSLALNTNTLRHNPSAGFRSVVQQAFDESQSRVPPTPSSTSESVVRSNSASASDISPIMSRYPIPGGPIGRTTTTEYEPTIVEETHGEKVPPLSSGSFKSATTRDYASSPSDPPIVPEYHRDTRTPSPGNSPARQPSSVATFAPPRAGLPPTSVGTPQTPSTNLWEASNVPLPAAADDEIQTTPRAPQNREFDVPRTQLFAKSPPRSESPSKGTVRDLADKLESQSGRSSPVGSVEQGLGKSRLLHARLESFRPSLPGGWQSYSTNVGALTPQPDATDEPGLPGTSMSNVSGDPPIAGPWQPRPRREDSNGPIKTAFAAAANAGSALVGAFSSVTGYHDSDAESWEREGDVSSTSESVTADERTPSNDDSAPAHRPDAPYQTSLTDDSPHPGRVQLALPAKTSESAASSIPTTPLLKDTSDEDDVPDSTLQYFPSPLRPTKSSDKAPKSRPQVNHTLSTDTAPQDTESDRLRKEIVRSLTPKASSINPNERPPFDEEPLPASNLEKHQHSGNEVDRNFVPSDHDTQRNQIDAASGRTSAAAPQLAPVSQGANSNSAHGKPSIFLSRGDYSNQRDLENTDAAPQSPPRLKQRFSWEAPSPPIKEGKVVEHVPRVTAPSPLKTGQQSMSDDSPRTMQFIQDAEAESPDSSRTLDHLSPKEATVPRPTELNDLTRSNTIDSGPAREERVTRRSESLSSRARERNLSDNIHEVPWSMPKEMPFREILALTTPTERIQACNESRRALAASESGLSHWLTATGSRVSEHSDIISANGRLSAQQAGALSAHRPIPSRTIFPKIATIGGATQHPHVDNQDGLKTFANSPSNKMTGTQMQEEGKKILQSAGKLGGKAGGAAKGLFAKGKSRFRTSSGTGEKAGRRSPQPVMVHENSQHSPTTATAAPQIPPQDLGVSSVGDNDTWSLSYAPTTQTHRSRARGRDVSPEPPGSFKAKKYANLGPPDYRDLPDARRGAAEQKKTSSPSVSAIGSVQADDAPSRSISEVTRATTSGDEQSLPHRVSSEALTSLASPENGTLSSTRNHTIAAPFVGESQADISEGNDMPTPRADDSNTFSPVVVTHDVAEETKGNVPSKLEKHTPLQPESSQFATLAAPRDQRRNSMVSAISSPSPGPPPSDSGKLSPSATRSTRRSVSPADAVQTQSSTQALTDSATSRTDSQKPEEAEADEGSHHTSIPIQQQGKPPIYRGAINDVSHQHQTRIGQDSAIIPVADLSARRRHEDTSSQSRPFSFVGSDNLEEGQSHSIETRGVLSTTQQATNIPSKSPKEAHRPTNEESSVDRRQSSKSYSRPFKNDASLQNHPVSQPLPVPGGRGPHQPTDGLLSGPQKTPHVPDSRRQSASSYRQPVEQYRIPGPYGHEFRSQKQTPYNFATRQISPPQVSQIDPIEEGTPLQTSHDFQNRTQGPERPDFQRATSTEYALPSDRRSNFQEPKRSTSPTRLEMSKNQPPVNSGVVNRDKVTTVETGNTGSKTDRKPRRSSMFRSKSRRDSEDSQRQLGGSRDGLNNQQPPSRARIFSSTPMINGRDWSSKMRPHKLQRASTSDSSVQKEANKKSFFRWSGLFGRSGPTAVNSGIEAQAEQPVQHASTPQPMYSPSKPPSIPQPAPYVYPGPTGQPNDPYAGPVTHGNNFRGQPPPVGGYYAPPKPLPPRPVIPQGPDSFGGDQSRFNQHDPSSDGFQGPTPASPAPFAPHPTHPQAQQSQQPLQTSWQQQSLQPPLPASTRPRSPQPNLRVDTSPSNKRAETKSATPPLTAPPTFEQRYANSNPIRQSPYEAAQTPRSPYGYGSARGLTKDTLSHTIDLHKRSRSPRNGRRNSNDDLEEVVAANHPASQLGTFNNSAAPKPGNGGMQEGPWRIGLPTGNDAARKGRRAAIERQGNQGVTNAGARNTGERTIADKVMGPSDEATMPLQRSSSSGNARTKSAAGTKDIFLPAELPGSRAPGDESDEEIVMSSTAYPGQEWMPEMAGYGHWED